MPVIIKLSLVLLILLTALTNLSACSGDDNTTNVDKIGIVVTLLPQAEFVEKVGGDKVDVTVMVPPGANPHIYEPTPNQMVTLSNAQMYVKMGSGIEFELAWMDKLANLNKDMHIVDCSKGVTFIEMNGIHEHGSAEHETENSHPHEGMDPHIWMSPLKVMIIVQNICDGLIQVDSVNQSYYELNRDTYLEQLSQLDHQMKEGLAGVENRIFMVYHPAFGYLAHDYNLTMLTVEDEGKEPTASGLAYIIDKVKDQNIKVVFTEPQFNPDNAETIAKEVGATVIFIDPLARDYIANMQMTTEKIISAMQ